MAIQRTDWIDDDGSGTTGTIINNAEKTLLYNQIDLLAYTVVSVTASGTVHNWNPGHKGHTFLSWAGSAPLSLTGFAGGLSGQRITITNVSTTHAISLLHTQGSTSGNQLYNIAWSAPTPVGPSGTATYIYDGTFWVLAAHQQGAWIATPFAAGDFYGNAGTVTVEAGDVGTYRSLLQGRTLSLVVSLNTISLSSGVTFVYVKLPSTWTASMALTVLGASILDNSASVRTLGEMYIGTNNTAVRLMRIDAVPWAASTNNTYCHFAISVPVN